MNLPQTISELQKQKSIMQDEVAKLSLNTASMCSVFVERICLLEESMKKLWERQEQLQKDTLRLAESTADALDAVAPTTAVRPKPWYKRVLEW